MLETQDPPEFDAWLINLTRSESRRTAMQAQLAAIGLPYILHNATDGRASWATLAPTVDLTAFRRNVGREVLPGEIGCYHSHLAVWQAFLDSGKAVALVMEDDVVFHPEFHRALEVALAASAEWDFLKLNKIRAKQPLRQKKLGVWNLNAYLGPATGLGAYLIRRDLVVRLLPAMLPITRPIDHELDRIHVHDFRHYGLEPFPSHVDDGNSSTITGQSYAEVRKFPWHQRLPLYGLRFRNMIGKLVYLARKGRLSAPNRKG